MSRPDLGRLVTAATPAKRQLRFGYFLVPLAAEPLIATAQRAERLGLDYVGIQDHPYQRRFVDTWSLMAMIAASTATLRIFPDVANLPPAAAGGHGEGGRDDRPA